MTRIHARSVEQCVNLDDGDEIYNWPWLYAVQVGEWGITEAQAKKLRDYLLRGGFFMADDFHGSLEWAVFEKSIKMVFPDRPMVEIPNDDAIFHTMFEIKRVPQVTSIRFWRATGGRETSERGEESRVPHFRGIRDKHGRIMAVMTHNTDVADSWEREGEDPDFFYQFSPDGYALGIDVLLYAMSH